MSEIATQIIGKLDVNQTLGRAFDAIENRNLSTCGRLLQSGKLSEKGFIIGSTIEMTGDLIKTLRISREAEAAVQLGLIDVMKQVLKNEQEFKMGVLEAHKRHTEALVNLAKELNLTLKEATQCSLEAIKSKDKDAITLARETVALVKETAIPALQDLFKGSAINPNLISDCAEASSSVLIKLLDTVPLVGGKSAEEIEKMTKAALEAGKASLGSLSGLDGEKKKQLDGPQQKALTLSSDGTAARDATGAAPKDGDKEKQPEKDESKRRASPRAAASASGSS